MKEKMIDMEDRNWSNNRCLCDFFLKKKKTTGLQTMIKGKFPKFKK